MQQFTKSLDFFVKPPRVNYTNLLFSCKEDLVHFELSNHKVISFDKTILSCTFLRLTAMVSHNTTLYVHSHGSSRYEGCQLIKSCHENQHNLMLFDSRASGESQGEHLTFGNKEKTDLLYIMFKCAIDFKQREFLLWGRSLGCTAILLFYDELVSNSGIFLNKKLQKIKTENQQLKNRSNKILCEDALKFANKQFPEKSNRFIQSHFHNYQSLNFPQQIGISKLWLKINGVILDSPYESLLSFLDENIKKKFNFLLSGVVSTFANIYIKNWTQKQLNIDVTINQNIDLISKININTVFIVSDKDDIVSYQRFQNLIDNFSKRCLVAAKPVVLNTHQSHGAMREPLFIKTVFHQFRSSISDRNYFILDFESTDKIDKPVFFSEKLPLKKIASMEIIDSKTNEFIIWEKSELVKIIPNLSMTKIIPKKERSFAISSFNILKFQDKKKEKTEKNSIDEMESDETKISFENENQEYTFE